MCVQWNLLIRTHPGPDVLSFVERLSFQWRFSIECVYKSTFILSFIGRLSSFGVSFIRGFTVLACYWYGDILCITGMVTSCVFLLCVTGMVMSCVFLLCVTGMMMSCVFLLCVTGMVMSCVFLLCITVDPSIIRTSLIRTLDYPNYQINDIHSICGVHQMELTSPIEIILLHLSEYSVIRMA